jgi:hypothetical protein
MAADRRAAPAALLILCLAAFGAGVAAAEDAVPEAPDAAQATTPAPEQKDYYSTLGPDGEVVFTQVIRWEADPQALEYRFTLREKGAAEAAPLVEDASAEAERLLHLTPGEYEYKIVTVNLLGKAEVETEWIGISVIKAEQPALTSSTPETIYMDAFDGSVTLVGEKLLPEGVATLVPKDGSAPFPGKVVSRVEDREIVVLFPDKAYSPGQFDIAFQNPGGLEAKIEDALRVRFQRPVDLQASVGYMPYVSINDNWIVENWPTTFFPAGLGADIELFFLKQRWGFLGIEAEGKWRRMVGGEDGAVITSDYLMYGANLVYKYRFSRVLHGLARLGGGIAQSKHGFDYDGFEGPSTKSSDPYGEFGLALQYYTPIKIYVELGAELDYIFLLGHYAFGLTPRLSVGYKIF